MAEKESHITSASSPCTVASAIPRYLRRKPSFEDTNAVYPSSPLVSTTTITPPLEGYSGPNRAQRPCARGRDDLCYSVAGSSTRSLPAMGAGAAPSQTTAHARQAATEQDVQRLRADVSELKAHMRQVDERLERTEEILQEHVAQKRKRRFFRSLKFRRR